MTETATAEAGKRQNGQYFTAQNPFSHSGFSAWAQRCGLPGETLLEPFAGANNIIEHLRDLGICRSFHAFDIEPSASSVSKRDTLASFPTGYRVCVTNPPWLAKNSATARGLNFPDCLYDNVYKFALDRCLENCRWVAALVPESFIRSKLFRKRLCGFVSLTSRQFAETDHPVGLAMFQPGAASRCKVWSGEAEVGQLADLESLRPVPTRKGIKVRFNDPNGNAGLIAADNSTRASIRFCKVGELADVEIKVSSRFLTKLSVDGQVRLDDWNQYLEDLRQRSHDVLLTSFKGIRKDGKYRRRLDFDLARGIIQNA